MRTELKLKNGCFRIDWNSKIVIIRGETKNWGVTTISLKVIINELTEFNDKNYIITNDNILKGDNEK